MSYFVIEWSVVPTNFNALQTFITHKLEGVVELDRGRPVLTDRQRVNFGGIGPHVIEKIYRDVDDVREVYYKTNGYAPSHISPNFKSLVKVAPPEVLV